LYNELRFRSRDINIGVVRGIGVPNYSIVKEDNSVNIYPSNIPYTYFIKWSITGKRYYGVRYAKNCCTDDFWLSYFTSSSTVKEYVSVFGAPDIIQIRQKFTGDNRVEKARIWEHRVLQRLQVVNRKDYLNLSDGKSIDPAASSKARTGVAPGNKGKPQSAHIKDKKRKPKPLVTCPHCSKSGGISAMTRWHFDKCGTDINHQSNQKIAQTNRVKSARPIVSEIRKISKSLGLKPGWYQLPDDQLKGILENYLSSRNVLNRGNRNE
jgi:hypothetical protein